MAISDLRDGRFIEVNVRFLRLFGYNREEVLGRTSIDLGMWAEPERQQAVREHPQQFGPIQNEEVAVRTRSGEVRRALLSAETAELRNQAVVITSLVDVTDLSAAQEAQARLGAAVEGSADAIYAKTLDGRITSWNSGAEAIYGYAAAEAIGRPISFIVPDDRRAELDRIMERLRGGWIVARFETVRVRKDGQKIVVSVTISPTHDEVGRLIGACAVSRDVTDQRRAERLMWRLQARFRMLFEDAADAILLIDRRGTILEVNPAGGALVGAKDPSALRGINLAELLPSHELEKARAYLRDLLHDRPSVEPFETYVEAVDGARRFIQVRSRVIREEGRDPYVQVIAREVTAEKAYQQQILESERRASMGQVAAFVAHEMNTPLTNIALLAETLTRATADPDVLEKLEMIQSQGRLATNIVAEVVSLTGSKEVRRIDTDVRSVVEAAVGQTIGYRHATVAVVKALPVDPVFANVDPLRLQRALVNLFKNAFQAATTGSVEVRLETSPESVTIGVTDTGPGMDEEVRTRLFQPFYTTKPRRDALGLGLVVAKSVVEAHGGRIEVASEVGKGSTFTVVLPKSLEKAP